MGDNDEVESATAQSLKYHLQVKDAKYQNQPFVLHVILFPSRRCTATLQSQQPLSNSLRNAQHSANTRN